MNEVENNWHRMPVLSFFLVLTLVAIVAKPLGWDPSVKAALSVTFILWLAACCIPPFIRGWRQARDESGGHA